MAVFKRMVCDIKLFYRATLIGSSSNFRNGDVYPTEHKICRNEACYMFPNTISMISWKDAQAVCEDMGGNLVSVNSDDEWRLLTSTSFIHSDSRQLLYIGYHSKVSHVSFV